MMPSEFTGIVCVGLFATPIPQSKPLACTIAGPNGDYQMQDAPQGKSFIFALGMEIPIQARDCFCHDSALRAGGNAVHISGDSIVGETDLILRAPLPTDPPILLFSCGTDAKDQERTAESEYPAAIPDLAGYFPHSKRTKLEEREG